MLTLAGAIFFIVGAALIICTIVKKGKCSAVTRGVVVDVFKKVTTQNDNNTTSKRVDLFPVVEYNIGGRKYVKKSSSSSNVTFIGKEVKVHYNPENPDESYFGTNMSAIAMGIIFMIVGAVVFATSFTTN